MPWEVLLLRWRVGLTAEFGERGRPLASRPLSSTLSGEVTSNRVLGADVEPLLRLGRHHRGQPTEVAGDGAHCVHRVAVANGQGVGTEFGVPLPGAVRRSEQHTFAHQADMDGHHLAEQFLAITGTLLHRSVVWRRGVEGIGGRARS
jgi:hypothetical protein